MTQRSHCHLLLAGPMSAPAVSVEKLTVLARVLSRGRLQETGAAWEHELCRLFGVNPSQECWPLAPLALLGEAVDPAGAVWMRADPVHFQLRRDSFALGLPLPPLAQEDAQCLVADLNRHFEGRGMVFMAPHPQRWYLKLERLPALKTFPLSQALGSDVGSCSPRGEDAGFWRSFVNELQMLLHDHPVNQRREAAGQIAVNSIWLDGAGRLPEQAAPVFDRVWADDALARGLASVAGIDCRPLPGFLRSGPDAGADLVVASVSEWQQLETEFLLPLINGLRTSRWNALTIDIGRRAGVMQCQLRRRDLWKFWRRPVNLEQCLG